MTTSEAQIEQYKQAVIQEWTDTATVTAWSKWFPQQSVQLQAGTDLLLEAAQPKLGMQVLDIAGGAGEPSYSLSRLVGPSGHITVTDLSAGMLAANEKNAHRAGLTNLSFQQADAHVLKFPDQQFDLATCRFGVMYFADGIRALKEIRRVLKPGGRAVFLAWGPLERNMFFASGLSPFFKRAPVPPPPAGAPTPFKYAAEGSLAEDLRLAGFREVHEETRTVPMPWPGSPENLWEHFYEAAVMFHPVFNGLAGPERAAAVGEVVDGFGRYFNGKVVDPGGCMIVATGLR